MNPIVFCHIPKTGGTSVQQLIADWLPGEVIAEHIDSENYSTAVHANRRCRAIIGHFWFRPGELLDSERMNITILREPVDRVLSHYFFSRQLESTLHPSAPERSLGLGEYADSDLPAICVNSSNFQTRLLAPLGLAVSNSKPTDKETLAGALRAIDLFNLVGDYAQLDDTAACIACVARVRMPGDLLRKNATTGRPTTADIPAEVRKRLEAINELDTELYLYARRKFSRTRRGLLVTCLDDLVALENFSTNVGEAAVSQSTSPVAAMPNRITGPRPSESSHRIRFGNRDIEVVRVSIEGLVSLASGALLSGETARITMRIAAHVCSDDLTVGLRIHDAANRLIFGTNTWLMGRQIRVAAGSVFSISFVFQNTLGRGRYTIGATLHTGSSHLACCYDWCDEVAAIDVVGTTGYHFEGSSRLTVLTPMQAIEGEPPVFGQLQLHRHLLTLARHNAPVKTARGRLEICGALDRIRAGDVTSIEIELESHCDQVLESDGLMPLRISYRWLDALTGTVVVAEGKRTNLEIDLPVGQICRTWVTVETPPNFRGPAILRLVPVQENVGWFDNMGTFYQDIPIFIAD
ncbi:MAG: Wzt carbohydrate-binding domain-containing protein [Steroidobacteraceae bacterium]|jgi:hypothetical protein